MVSECSVKILLIEDNLAEARLLQEFLKQTKFSIFNLVHVQRLGDAFQQLHQYDFDVILLDLTLPDSEGLASLKPIFSLAPSIPVVVLTNNNDELALEAVRQGAQDYLVKRQVNPEILVRSLRYAIERKQTLESLRAVNHSLETRVEERTAELVKAQEINQFKSEFVSMLSHDIRNPLNTILLAAGLLQNNYEQLPKEKQLNHFKLIRSAVKNMAQLLDEASFIGKTDIDKFQCQLIALNLQEFCQQLIQELRLSIEEKRLRLIFTTQGEMNLGLWDENLLRHILSNLLANAIKYSPDDSQIHFSICSEENYVIFHVQDWGMGIPEADISTIFQPFHRASNVGRIPGSGLGLAIVKKCVEVCQGKIIVESQENQGTTFTVTLPVIED
ncbi:hybrid sensor histidine kinase/response regulator [Calothrix sp. 336/3]|uniref:hybrid sensor histidine kinase/response regulator n=1 Tax=Calothrix sp. 336/3 TaxID=1337936 RepID=UPI0004E2A23A|nr:hybrid sensor histidine kinase/response regulator [Calothrix sp. 336/3]AKG23688.1 histidine kinase [Calothrix sp. 336/3]